MQSAIETQNSKRIKYNKPLAIAYLLKVLKLVCDTLY